VLQKRFNVETLLSAVPTVRLVLFDHTDVFLTGTDSCSDGLLSLHCSHRDIINLSYVTVWFATTCSLMQGTLGLVSLVIGPKAQGNYRRFNALRCKTKQA